MLHTINKPIFLAHAASVLDLDHLEADREGIEPPYRSLTDYTKLTASPLTISVPIYFSNNTYPY